MQEAIAMVNGQLKPNNITNPSLLKAMEQLDRAKFVPEAEKSSAYRDAIIPLNAGRYLLPPLVIAQMIQALNIKPNEVVLDLACSTGYTACILSYLAKQVYAVDRFPQLLNIAQDCLAHYDATNVKTIVTILDNGAEKEAPYDAILIPAAVANVPKNFFEFLSPHGRLITIVKQHPDLAYITLFKKSNHTITASKISETNAPVLHEFKQEQHFNF